MGNSSQKTQVQTTERMDRPYLELKAEQTPTWGLSGWLKFKLPFRELNDREVKFRDVWNFMRENQGNEPTDMQELERELPMQTPDFTAPIAYGTLKATWIGHSTVVLQDGDVTFLFDPVFSERASPVSFAGPKRFRPPACRLQGLPPIDAVFVSHDHYDHFDSNTNRWLQENRNPQFVIGEASNDLFSSKARVTYVTWNEEKTLQIKNRQYKLYFFPVCHWSKRGIFDTNKRLWGGFVITTPEGRRFFYPGDTGYCGVFKEIGAKFGEFDLAMIPIGAYHPRQFLGPQHVDPLQAVKIHKDIKCKKSFGVHWGTFPLGKEHYLAPRKDLSEARIKEGLAEDAFVCLKHGQSVVASGSNPRT